MKVCPQCGGSYPVEEGFCPMDGARLGAAGDPGPNESQIAADALLHRVLDRRYRLDAVIGRGAMAFVYKATHTLIGKAFAVKLIRPEHNRDPQVIARFLQEARLASAIKHPNVVDISDYGELPEGGAFYAMEYMRGETLAERIDDQQALPPEHALGLAVQVASGLQAAHDHGIVHRDLKPENVFLTRHEVDLAASASTSTAAAGPMPLVKLLDFGIARAAQSKLTVAGAVLGTPEYMAPEQARGDKVDRRADLYALGVILFEMLTGLVPFRSDDVAATLYSQIHHDAPPLSQVAENLGHLGQTERLVARLLSKDRDARPDTAEEVRTLLLAAMRQDLGNEAAQRVVRSTLSMGSGAVSATKPPEKNVGPVAVELKEPPMAWGKTERPDVPAAGAKRSTHVSAHAAPRDRVGPNAPPAIEPTPMSPLARAPNLPLIMAMTAVLAGGATLGVYGALWGFERDAPGGAADPVNPGRTPEDAVKAGALPAALPSVPRSDVVAAPSTSPTLPDGAEAEGSLQDEPGTDADEEDVAAPAAPGRDDDATTDRPRKTDRAPRSSRHKAKQDDDASTTDVTDAKPSPTPPAKRESTKPSPQVDAQRDGHSRPGDLKDPFDLN